MLVRLVSNVRRGHKKYFLVIMIIIHRNKSFLINVGVSLIVISYTKHFGKQDVWNPFIVFHFGNKNPFYIKEIESWEVWNRCNQPSGKYKLDLRIRRSVFSFSFFFQVIIVLIIKSDSKTFLQYLKYYFCSFVCMTYNFLSRSRV